MSHEMTRETSGETSRDKAHAAPRSKSLDKLIYMANQIGTFFASQGEDEAVTGTSTHIRKFWDARMRNAILAHLDATGGAGLLPNVREAVKRLRD